MLMKQAREDMRKMTLCTTARSICHVIRTSRCILEKGDVITMCSMCADICNIYCKKASVECNKAIKSLKSDNEEDYIKYCKRASEECEGWNSNEQQNNIIMNKINERDPSIA